MPARPGRRATQVQRRFTPDDLAALGRDDRRKLTQVLLGENGSRVIEIHRPVAYDELLVETRLLWRSRRVRVRIANRRIEQHDVDRLVEAVDAGGDAEGVLVAALGASTDLQLPPTVLLIEPDELIARMERCTAIA